MLAVIFAKYFTGWRLVDVGSDLLLNISLAGG